MRAQQPRFVMPDALVILFFIAIVAGLAAWLVPAGQFSTETVTRVIDGETQTREILAANSFTYSEDDSFQRPFFATGGEIGLTNVPFEGLVAGTKWGSAIGVIAFMLVVGGAFGMVMKTRTIEYAILALIERTQKLNQAFIVLMFMLFALGGAIFGMGEEAIAFCLVLLPVMRTLGYDAVTTVLVTYVATQIGFATSWMNPFSVAIAQGIAEVPILSGALERGLAFVVFTAFGLTFTLRYAARVRNPHAAQQAKEEQQASQDPKNSKYTHLDTVILLLFLSGIVWVIWGVMKHAYYIPEIATQFFIMGTACGIAAVIGGRLRANDLAEGFKEGAKDLLPAALIVGFAKGLILLLGGDTPTEASVLNTVLHHAGLLIGDFSTTFSAVFMLIFQSVFNFFVSSGSGQAALTMPLMAPLADLVGVSRQVSVLAFQLGDGLTNIIIPTSASLIGCLGAVKLGWGDWVKAIWRFQLGLMLLSIATIVVAVVIGF